MFYVCLFLWNCTLLFAIHTKGIKEKHKVNRYKEITVRVEGESISLDIYRCTSFNAK